MSEAPGNEVLQQEIKNLKKSVDRLRGSVDNLDSQLRGDGDDPSVLERLTKLETNQKIVIAAGSVLLSAVVYQLAMVLKDSL